MQLIKKVFNSILILVGILLMVALFAFAIMMIFHVNLFGYTYASQNMTGDIYYYDQSKVNSLEIDTDAADIVLTPASDASITKVSVVMIQDFQGIVKSDVKKYSYNVATNTEGTKFSNQPVLKDGVLKIATKEPKGLLFRNKTVIKIALPQKKGSADYILNSLKISTASDAVDIGNDHAFTVNDMTLVNKNKSLLSKIAVSDYLTIQGKLNLETSYGRITINSTIKNNVHIKTEGGSIIFNKDVEGDVYIEGKNPYIEFGSVPEKPVNTLENSKVEEYTRQKKMEKNAKIIEDLDRKIESENRNINKALQDIKQVNIKGNLNIIDCEDGDVKVGGTVYGFVYIQSQNVQFWANNVEDGITCDSGANNIRVFGSLCKTKPGKTCTIKNGDGHLYINHCYANVDIYATKNGVFIKNAHSNVSVDNKNYGTTVNFAEGVFGKTLEVHQEKGKITATNLSGRTILQADTNSVTAEFLDIKNENVITAKSGATIKVCDGKIYTFVAIGKAKAVKLDVSLGSVKYDSWNSNTDNSLVYVKDNITYRHDNINTSTVPTEVNKKLSDSLTVSITDSGKIKTSIFQMA